MKKQSNGDVNTLNGVWLHMSKNPLNSRHVPSPVARFIFDNGNWIYQIKTTGDWINLGRGVFTLSSDGNRINMHRTHFHKIHFATLSGFELATDPEWLDRNTSKAAKIAYFVWSEARQPTTMEIEKIDNNISHDFGLLSGDVFSDGDISQFTVLGKRYTKQ